MEESPRLNPWLSIWTRPRRTIQQIVDTDPKANVLLLAALSGMVPILLASSRLFGEGSIISLIAVPFALVGGPLLGVAILYAYSWLIFHTGRWLGGAARLATIRTAIAWSYFPSIVAGIVAWIIPASWLISSALNTVLACWGLFITLSGLAQVQGFSVWRALGNLLLVGFSVYVLGILAAILRPAVLG